MERRGLSWLNRPRRFASHTRVHGRLERTDEPPTGISPGRAGPRQTSSVLDGAVGDWPHRVQIDAIGRRQVIQAFGNAPCARSGTPTAQRFAEIRGERPCIALDGVESRAELVDIGSIV